MDRRANCAGSCDLHPRDSSCAFLADCRPHKTRGPQTDGLYRSAGSSPQEVRGKDCASTSAKAGRASETSAGSPRRCIGQCHKARIGAAQHYSLALRRSAFLAKRAREETASGGIGVNIPAQISKLKKAKKSAKPKQRERLRQRVKVLQVCALLRRKA